jgi:hypothetical protein
MLQVELHHQERPIALQTQLLANVNRDQKRQRKPHQLEDFFLYQPREEKDLPVGRCGSAAVELIKQGMFPSWGLFCYKELASSANGMAPPLLAFMSEDAILLAPIKTPVGFKGMLIAQESAGGKWVEMTSPCGRTETLFVPELETKVVAQDNITLQSR